MIRLTFLVLILASAMAADQVDQKATEKPAKAPDAQALKNPPKVAIVGAPVDPKSYIIGPEDVLMVKVWRENDLSGPVSVSPDGKISMQLINEVQAAGLTPDQLARQITQKLGNLMQHPEVTVQVASVNSKKFFISGEVNHPGAFPLVVPTHVMEALIQSGGFRDFAKLSKIYVLRGSTKYHFNYKDVSKGKHSEQNILLENGDTIFVP